MPLARRKRNGQCCMNLKPNACLTTLRKRQDFVAMRSGRRQHSRSFVLQMRERSKNDFAKPGVRIGYTVTKKVGNAVERNRIKRRMRAIVDRVIPFYPQQSIDYVLIGKRSALNTKFEALAAELGVSLNRLHANWDKSGTENGI